MICCIDLSSCYAHGKMKMATSSRTIMTMGMTTVAMAGM